MADEEETMQLFILNSVDFTSKVVQKSYSVQRQDTYTTWQDANWVTHRVIARQQVAGSFTMTFTSETDYDAFTSALAAVKTTGGYCPCSVYVNNEKQLRAINAFIDFSTKLVWTAPAFGQTPEVASVTVKITER